MNESNITVAELRGHWVFAGFEGRDAADYDDVLDTLRIEFKDAAYVMVAHYKADVLIQFRSNPNMSPEGEVITTGRLVVDGDLIRLLPSEDEDDSATLFFHNGVLSAISDIHEVTLLLRRADEGVDEDAAEREAAGAP